MFIIDGPVNPVRLAALAEGDHSPELRDPAFVAPVAAALRERTDIFAAIRERDMLLHHPYENFSSVVDFLHQAAADPNVLAIKQTLYRTGGDSQIVGALMEAVRNGKQVTAVVEFKARFDEANNILWARRLEEAGVHVVYGLVGCKIHAKMCLVVRKDADGIRRYLHLGTGNYNPATARLYTDLSLFTCRPAFGEDATNLFNLLTGICQFQGTRKLLVAPFELHARMIALIEREAANAAQGPARPHHRQNERAGGPANHRRPLSRLPGRVCQIDLIVRGICCLRPASKASASASPCAALWTVSSNTAASSTLKMPASRKFSSAAPTGCRAISSAALKSFSPSKTAICANASAPNSGNHLADNVKARFLQPGGSYTAAPPPRRQTARAAARANSSNWPNPRRGRRGGWPNAASMPASSWPPAPSRKAG